MEYSKSPTTHLVYLETLSRNRKFGILLIYFERRGAGAVRRGGGAPTYFRPAYTYVNGEEIPSVIIIWKEKFRTYSCPIASLPFPRPQSPSDRSTMRTCILGCILASLILFAWVECDPRSPKGGGRGDSREGKCKYPYKIDRRWRGVRRWLLETHACKHK